MKEISRQRARSSADREQRAQAILDAAHDLLRETSFPALTIADVAARAGLAKGTVFLYYPTKEALGLALTVRLLDGWFDAIDAALAGVPLPGTPESIAALIVDSITPRRDLVRLLTILGAILEHNIDAATARTFKQRLLERTTATGSQLERALPFLEAGDGARLVLLIHALVVGLHQMAEPAPIVSAVLEQPELAPLRIDFDAALRATLETQFAGLQAQRSES